MGGQVGYVKGCRDAGADCGNFGHGGAQFGVV